jgi:hypothetical protein
MLIGGSCDLDMIMDMAESFKRRIPEPLKPPLRLVLKSLKRNPVKEFRIGRKQEKLLRENYPPNTENLIIFLTPGYDVVNGGILSISSIANESMKLKHIHGAEVLLCTLPGDPPLLKYTKFANSNYIFKLSQVLRYFKNLKSIMIHIPEYGIDQFIKNLSSKEYTILKTIKNIHFNIMIQNIKLLSSINGIKKLERLGKVTCTTAHDRYSTLDMRKKLGVPLHKLSTYVSPEQYIRKSYSEKEDLIIVSPDNHPRKMEILRLIHKQIPQLKMQIIKNLTYEDYKKIISRAKWALTFGEGLDGYFVETIFSGGISFAVWNPDFFTEDFKSLRTIYENYDILAKRICSDIKELDNAEEYAKYQAEQYNLCKKYYNYKSYVKNLELFYKGEYTYR